MGEETRACDDAAAVTPDQREGDGPEETGPVRSRYGPAEEAAFDLSGKAASSRMRQARLLACRRGSVRFHDDDSKVGVIQFKSSPRSRKVSVFTCGCDIVRKNETCNV